MTSRELGALLLLGAIWGASFIFMRVAAPEFGIVPLVVLRTSLATLVFLPFLFLGKRIKWLILPLHESETDRHLIGLSG